MTSSPSRLVAIMGLVAVGLGASGCTGSARSYLTAIKVIDNGRVTIENRQSGARFTVASLPGPGQGTVWRTPEGSVRSLMPQGEKSAVILGRQGDPVVRDWSLAQPYPDGIDARSPAVWLDDSDVRQVTEVRYGDRTVRTIPFSLYTPASNIEQST
jgi:hypothetical protein